MSGSIYNKQCYKKNSSILDSKSSRFFEDHTHLEMYYFSNLRLSLQSILMVKRSIPGGGTFLIIRLAYRVVDKVGFPTPTGDND